MRFKCMVLVPAIMAGILCGAVAHATAKPDTLVYDMKVKSAKGDLGTRTMSMKGSNFAFDVRTGGIDIRFIKNKDGAFLINPMRSVVGKYPPGSNRNSPMVFMPGPIGDVKAFLNRNKAKKIGAEKINKSLCDVYSYSENETHLKCNLSVDHNTLQPMKLVLLGKTKNNNVVATYVSYKRGVQVADSIFTLPKGAKISPMPTPGEVDKKIKELKERPGANKLGSAVRP